MVRSSLLLLAACGSGNGPNVHLTPDAAPRPDSALVETYDCDVLRKVVTQFRATCRVPLELSPFGDLGCPVQQNAYCTAPGTCPTSGWGVACDDPGPADCEYGGTCEVVDGVAEFDYAQILNGEIGMAVHVLVEGEFRCAFRRCNEL